MHSGINGQQLPSIRLKCCFVNTRMFDRRNTKLYKISKNKATSDLSVGPVKHKYREISLVTHDLISCYFSQDIFPEPLKCAKAIPQHENGQKSDVTKYRTIPLLSVFSKRAKYVKLAEHLNSNNILHDSQYGLEIIIVLKYYR